MAATSMGKDGLTPLKSSQRPFRPKWVIISTIIIMLIAIALAIALGVGLTQARRHRDDSSSSSTTVATTTLTASSTGTPRTGADVWKPSVGANWDLLLLNPPSSAGSVTNTSVLDIDLFDTPASLIDSLHAANVKVICYFSAGSYEDWRPDASNFSTSSLGSPLDGWQGEWWLNTSTANVRSGMTWRLDLAVTKKCDGVDPDNMDGYSNDNGLDLTQDDAINYIRFLAAAAQARGLAIGLKNAQEIIPNVIDLVQWSVNEQCEQYQACDAYQPFISQGKPVFHVEYPKGDKNDNNNVSAETLVNICGDASAKGFSTIVKNMELGGWIERC